MEVREATNRLEWGYEGEALGSEENGRGKRGGSRYKKDEKASKRHEGEDKRGNKKLTNGSC